MSAPVKSVSSSADVCFVALAQVVADAEDAEFSSSLRRPGANSPESMPGAILRHDTLSGKFQFFSERGLQIGVASIE